MSALPFGTAFVQIQRLQKPIILRVPCRLFPYLNEIFCSDAIIPDVERPKDSLGFCCLHDTLGSW
jgi:hypothetical protein